MTTATATPVYEHVSHLWDDATADALDPVARLVYRSNLLGQDQRVTNTGGGNTSSKLAEADPISGEPGEVLWVKGSGGDLRTAKRENFASLYQNALVALQKVYAASANPGLKTEDEDRMVALYPHCTFNLNPRASSIDTPLHSFLPAKHVDHMHPNAVISIAAARRSKELTQEVFGDEVDWVEWMRPGFELGLAMQQMVEAKPNLKGIVMGQHGIINWDDDDRACYDLTLDLIEKAARFIDARHQGDETFGGARYHTLGETERDAILVSLMPWLRGQVSQHNRFVATFQGGDAMLRFINSNDAPRLAELGTSCPDHFLRTKIKPLYLDWNPKTESADDLKARIGTGLDQYRRDYAAYYEACKRPGSPAMRDPNPTVILIPGVGMIAFGKNKSESRVTAEFYNCAVEVMRGAEAIDEYIALPQQEAFDIEYWALEEAKLKRMPPEQEFARRIVMVIGAGNGIGKETALRFAREGAHVICADLDLAAAEATAAEIAAFRGEGIGVSGTGISSCGFAIGCEVDVTSRASIRALLDQATLAYGGVDEVVVTAGVYIPPAADGSFQESQWETTFNVNVKGNWLVADELRSLWEAQGLDGSLILTTSVNGVVPKAGSLAYDASKAAANHLVRELAMELAPNIRVNAVAPATVVAGSTMFPRDRVIASLTKYDIDFNDSESTETLRDKLAGFYAGRTLTKEPVTPEDQANAVFFLSSRAARKTTGQIISVDGGLHEAFLR